MPRRSSWSSSPHSNYMSIELQHHTHTYILGFPRVPGDHMIYLIQYCMLTAYNWNFCPINWLGRNACWYFSFGFSLSFWWSFCFFSDGQSQSSVEEWNGDNMESNWTSWHTKTDILGRIVWTTPLSTFVRAEIMVWNVVYHLTNLFCRRERSIQLGSISNQNENIYWSKQGVHALHPSNRLCKLHSSSYEISSYSNRWSRFDPTEVFNSLFTNA